MNKKYFLPFITTTLLINIIAATAQPYVRAYDSLGKRIARGYVEKTTDSTMRLKLRRKHDVNYIVDISKVYCIKANRSWPAYSFTGFALGLTSGILIAVAADKYIISDDPKVSDAIDLIIVGSIAAGTMTGTIVGIAKKRRKFIINNSLEQWQEVRSLVQSIPTD